MTQFTFGNIDETTTDGFVLATMLESFEAAINTDHAGVTEPFYKVTGIVWRDTSGSPHIVKKWDGSQWVVLGTFNTSTHVWTPYFAGSPITALATKAIGDGLEDSAGNLRIKLDGSSLSRSSAGLKLPNSGVSAGTYDSANITVDAFGRITSAEDGVVQGFQLINYINVSGSPTSLSFNDVFVPDWSYMLELNSLRQDAGNAILGLRFGTSGSSYITSGYRHDSRDFVLDDTSVSGNAIVLTPGQLRPAHYFSGHIMIPNPMSASQYKNIVAALKYTEHSTTSYRQAHTIGELPNIATMASIQLTITGSNFHSGRVSLYGWPNA